VPKTHVLHEGENAHGRRFRVGADRSLEDELGAVSRRPQLLVLAIAPQGHATVVQPQRLGLPVLRVDDVQAGGPTTTWSMFAGEPGL
jgi:hypothetical protein